jgi:hypothetical protein
MQNLPSAAKHCRLTQPPPKAKCKTLDFREGIFDAK